MNVIDYDCDFIVIGSGPGGCGAAYNLLKKNAKVWMFEAGDDKDNDVAIKDPTYAEMLESNYYPQYFWVVSQMFQENANLPTANYTNGRCYGGGTSVNGMQYVRGSKNMFQKWYEITGDHDWHPDTIFALYKDFEKLTPANPSVVGSVPTNASQGVNGYVNVRQAPNDPTPGATKFVNAIATATGLTEIIDYNDPDMPYGPFTRWQYYQQPNGLRESSSTAVLKKLLIPDLNFKLLPKATIVRLLFNGKVAIGVEYIQGGVMKKAYAKVAVVVSAGTQTPLLLQHSGIGDAARLTSYGIPVVSDLHNVGENLMNHLLVTTVFSKDVNDAPSPDANALYSFGAFLPQPVSPDLTKPRATEWIGIDAGDSMVVVILQAQPVSKGYAHIQSGDFLTTPLVTEAAFDDPADVQFFKDLIKNQLIPIANELHNANPAYNLVQPDPVQSLDPVNGDAYMDSYIRGNVDHAHHWQSQCIMAPKEAGGVVDNNGKVYGVERLYIADTCIVPFTVDNNTAGSAYIIGHTIGKKLAREFV